MKTKLSLLAAALLPLAVFGQTVAKKSVQPFNKKAIAQAMISNTARMPFAYCTPTILECSDGDVITNVTIGTINNTTDCSASGYSDFTSMAATVTPGQVVPVSVSVGDGWFERVSIWVDWNKNDTFEEAELMTDAATGLGGGTSDGGALTGNITVPASAQPGSYRMRVMAIATGSDNPAPEDPCVDEQYGEVEDYTLTIAAPATGCLNATGGQWPSGTFSPNCNGSAGNITTAAYVNEYSKVNVIAGTKYTFSTSKTTFYITISDANGTKVLAGGNGSVEYTPTASGVVRFYSHLTANCDGSQNLHTRTVMCGTPPPPPVTCEDFKVTSATIENGAFFNGDKAQRLAIDLPVGANSLTAYGMEINVAGVATYFNFTVYNDNAGKPGTQLTTRTGTIKEQVSVGNNFGFEFYKNTVGFDSPLTLDPNKRYWVEVKTDAVAWQSTATSGLGSRDAFLNSDTAGAWTIGTADYVFKMICSTLGVNNISSATKLSYYPNPVKDILTLSTSDKIESVLIYNVAGQKMNVSPKAAEGKIDMTRLASGIYIVNITLANGQKETFKIVKQ